MKILIVEDELALNKIMVEYLSSQQYLCEAVSNYRDALEKIEVFDYDCIVLDIMLPDGNGLQIVKALKAMGKTDGVIIISAKNELDDKITGLNLGADDYLTKPFHLSELSVRVAAIIRRKSLNGNSLLVFGEITIDAQARNVSIKDRLVSLTRKEYELLLYLIVNKNKVISKNSIAEHLWGDDMDIAGSYDPIYAHIKNLRKKLVSAGAPDYLKSVYGLGYKFAIH
jgi:DNA-binding response OmpR family regulator